MGAYTKLKKIDRQLKLLRKESYKEQERIAKILIPKFKKDYIGRCYKYENSYGSSSDCKPWNLYIKITDVTNISFFDTDKPTFELECFQFQLTSDDRFEVEMKKHMYGYSLDSSYKEIIREDFNVAYANLSGIVNKEAFKND